ncbi:hypothetical protein C7Y69_08080 [Alteromonas sp. KS69]|mgnify:CR=1|jgi:hypothetical protein|uniref:hypothetical protein n=1 Tax=unclassified Alteromonas TaxID=2614992 RepID=UPI000F86E043|nr:MULTISPECIES: hypothetical protein [unclassified Alteromonas]MBO7921496.1 hypothetical protein [Alteromonas sp. K632G]RUP81713.1 hypothetical protein C7Y69_08080 [Alteromonas sp. KS69]|tara:strand:- start:1831 stop:2040 length:210 start_codon:yes stop_codon:yes gene_type:complete
MNINATLFGQVIVVFALLMAALGYYLGKRKTRSPNLTAVVAFFSALVPPLAIILLIVLVLKNDVKTSKT